MHRSPFHRGHRTLRRPGRAFVMAVMLCLVTSGTASADTFDSFAATDSTFPVIAHIATGSERSDEIVIAGHGFTPGGQVYIVIHDLWGATLHENRWITASEVSYQPPPDLPPGEGFSFDTGGNIAEWFHLSIGMATVPDGSQNPALGPVTGLPTTMAGVGCTTSLMMMAYDRTTAVWSDTVGITLGCAG